MAILTDADRKRMGAMHPDMSAALESSPFPDLTGGLSDASVQTVRHNRAAHLAKLRHLYAIPGPIPDEVGETDHQVLTRDGNSIPVRIYIPKKASSSLRPLIVMYHEGGWRMGDLTDEDQNCRMFARDLDAVCVNVDYRLAPEHKFPAGVNDAYDTLLWCTKTASPTSNILPADLKVGFIVGGSSAGGNFAAVMCQRARDERLDPPLTGQYLSVPALLSKAAVPDKFKDDYRSRSESNVDPVLKVKDREGTRVEHLDVEVDNPMYAPLLHHNLDDLPPAYFQLGGLDPLRDEGLKYERELRERGTLTRLKVYDGFGHMFWTNWPTLQQSKDFVNDTLEGVRWLLETNRRR